jgi:predicted XRE-type DNA-binding protein
MRDLEDPPSSCLVCLAQRGLSVRAAQARTGIAAADFSRLRSARLSRFTIDRLMLILNRLGARIEVRIKVKRMQAVAA